MASSQEPLPSVIPKVEWVDGEPVIAREQVVKPSPVPRSLVIIIVILAAISVGYTFIEQERRNDAQAAQNREDDRQDAELRGLVDGLAMQQAQATRERERLRMLVFALIAADTDAERLALLEDFAQTGSEDPPPAPVQPSSSSPGGSAPTQVESPGESPSDAETSPPQEQPDPPESEEPSPEPEPPPTIVDVPPLLGDCADTPLGRICT